jgi:hypothetical protein
MSKKIIEKKKIMEMENGNKQKIFSLFHDISVVDIADLVAEYIEDYTDNLVIKKEFRKFAKHVNRIYTF